MNISVREALAFAALAIATCTVSGAGWAQQEADAPATGPASAASPVWPSRFYLGDDAFTVYPPQLERWEGDRLEGRAAVALQAAGAEAPVFGTVALSARTSVDAASAMVTVSDIAAGPGSFPTAGGRAVAYLDAVQRHLATLTWRVTLARLQADLAIDRASAGGQNQPLRNDPPWIVYVQSPTILVPIDGEPVLREMAGLALLRVANTRALILQDKVANRYFLYVAGYWLEAPTLEGRWVEAQVRPVALDEAKRKALAEGWVDLLEDDEPASPVAPKVVVSTKSTELVQTDGPPQYAPIGRTDLLLVTNSPNRLFLDLRTQTHYVLLAGRWYRSQSLARGPWDYVPGADLPADFALIPDDHPTASVRAAVPGTAEAQESVIVNSVPEIATVKRSAARLEITYDGAPEFRPIQGTALEAAANAPVPVIRVDARTYYALDNGVWFFSDSAQGPWTAATSVPAVIYAIPRSHPLHYVTYVRVYDAMGDDVYVGYTPGYVGSYVTTESTVVYGTGWYYRPWIGTVWYAPPVTWGFGFSFYYSWWNPWPARVWWPAWRPVRCFRPAWGPWPHQHVGVKTFGVAGGPPNHGHVANVAGGRRHGWTALPQNTTSGGGIYRRWDSRSVSSHHFGGRPDGRWGASATDRSAAFQSPMSRQRDDRRPPLDRNERFGESRRPQVDGPRWVRPEARVNRQGQGAGRVDAPPRSATRPQGGMPARPPAGADHPRSPGLWAGNRGPGESGPRQSDGGNRFERQQRPQHDAGRWARRGDAAAPARQDPRWSMPHSAQQQPRDGAVDSRPRGDSRSRGDSRPRGDLAPGGPNGAREFRAPSRQQHAQRDRMPAAPAATTPGPRMSRPAAAIPRSANGPGAPRNGSASGPR